MQNKEKKWTRATISLKKYREKLSEKENEESDRDETINYSIT